MDKTYSIRHEQIDAYVARQLKKKIIALYIIFTPFCLLLPVLMDFRLKSMIPASFFAAVGFTSYLLMKNITENMARSMQITFIANGVIRSHDLDLMGNFARSVLELTTANRSEKLDCIIKFGNLFTTTIKDREIVIEARNAEALNNIGIIRIPKEISGFAEILMHIKSNPKSFRLIS